MITRVIPALNPGNACNPAPATLGAAQARTLGAIRVARALCQNDREPRNGPRFPIFDYSP
jgi:hypothetical protein